MDGLSEVGSFEQRVERKGGGGERSVCVSMYELRGPARLDELVVWKGEIAQAGSLLLSSKVQ